MSPPEQRLLLVEDNPGDARLLREMLRDVGHDDHCLQQVTTVEEALSSLGGGGYDAVFLDLDLPDSRGLQTLQRVREAGHDVPIIVLTGFDDQDTGARSVDLGAQDYLVKGEVHADVLARVVRYARGRHQAMAAAKRESARAAAAEARLRTLEEGRAALEREVKDRRLAQAELEQTLARLQASRSIDQAIIANDTLQPMLQVVLHEGMTLLDADAASILLVDDDEQALVPTAHYGAAALTRGDERIPRDDAAVATALQEGSTTLDLEVVAQGAFSREPAMRRTGFRGYHVVPFSARGVLLGALEIFSHQRLAPTPDWSAFTETLAAQAAVAVDSVRLRQSLIRANRDLRAAYDATIDGWSRALDLRDRETEGHSRRVTELSMRLARAVGVDGESLGHLRRGALLHDIGKMGVPDTILQKPGPLDDDEWVIMRRHTTFARDLLMPIAYLRPAVDVPYSHHERWDGSGYPQGLQGSAIPLRARIFAVADVYDALTSDRPYRRAWSQERAIRHIAEQAGRHFDPEIVTAFLELQRQ